MSKRTEGRPSSSHAKERPESRLRPNNPDVGLPSEMIAGGGVELPTTAVVATATTWTTEEAKKCVEILASNGGRSLTTAGESIYIMCSNKTDKKLRRSEKSKKKGKNKQWDSITVWLNNLITASHWKELRPLISRAEVSSDATKDQVKVAIVTHLTTNPECIRYLERLAHHIGYNNPTLPTKDLSPADLMGITYSKQYEKYVSSIVFKGKPHFLGRFKLASDAGLARDQALKAVVGIAKGFNFCSKQQYLDMREKEITSRGIEVEDVDIIAAKIQKVIKSLIDLYRSWERQDDVVLLLRVIVLRDLPTGKIDWEHVADCTALRNRFPNSCEKRYLSEHLSDREEPHLLRHLFGLADITDDEIQQWGVSAMENIQHQQSAMENIQVEADEDKEKHPGTLPVTSDVDCILLPMADDNEEQVDSENRLLDMAEGVPVDALNVTAKTSPSPKETSQVEEQKQGIDDGIGGVLPPGVKVDDINLDNMKKDIILDDDDGGENQTDGGANQTEKKSAALARKTTEILVNASEDLQAKLENLELGNDVETSVTSIVEGMFHAFTAEEEEQMLAKIVNRTEPKIPWTKIAHELNISEMGCRCAWNRMSKDKAGIAKAIENAIKNYPEAEVHYENVLKLKSMSNKRSDVDTETPTQPVSESELSETVSGYVASDTTQPSELSETVSEYVVSSDTTQPLTSVIDGLPLPPGWEELTDPQTGRLYYHNYVHQTTTWDRPLPALPEFDSIGNMPVFEMSMFGTGDTAEPLLDLDLTDGQYLDDGMAGNANTHAEI